MFYIAAAASRDTDNICYHYFFKHFTFFSLSQTRQPELLFRICMDLQHYISSYSVGK